MLLAVDSSAVQGMGPWFVLYPSLAFCFAVMLPLGLATNWLKRNVKFDFFQSAAAEKEMREEPVNDRLKAA